MYLRKFFQSLRSFFELEASAGILLAISALAAIVVSNSPLANLYQQFVGFPGEINLGNGALVLRKSLAIWVNELWMAIFFFLVGLELKREIMVGELSVKGQLVLPACAAAAGMAVPSLIFYLINSGDAQALRGWAIPAATDIAFALGVLMLLGSRVPLSLKVFLTAVAILDDMGAIIIIAVFYTADLSPMMLMGALCGIAMLALLNRAGVMAITPYVVVGFWIWLFVLKSGVHATLAGVITALAIPMGSERDSPLQRVEHWLHPWVAFGVLPAFAFVNAGIPLADVSFASISNSVTVGIALGLMLGKSLGVFLLPMLLIRLGVGQMPAQANALQFFGMAAFCGVGFTMSLFIGSLAYEGLPSIYELQTKMGVMLGSALSMALGTLIFLLGARKAR